MTAPKKIIIVRKKKKAHGGHHGGSWKVAYADFVTAMMAFFLVMWIMGMDQGVKDIVQGYFNNPIGFKRSFSGGKNILSQGNSITNLDVRRNVILERRQAEEARLGEIGEAIEAALAATGIDPAAGASVQVVVTDQGLRIEMMETNEGHVFFDAASARLQPALENALRVVARNVVPVSNGVIVEGHTDSSRFGGTSYTNWELSVDRANAARRVLIAAGLPDVRVTEVRGYADRHPRIPGDGSNPTNRRISLLLPFDTPDIESLETRLAQLLGAPAAAPIGAAR